MSSTPPSNPIEDFSTCHAGILEKLGALGSLSELLRAAAEARRIAAMAAEFYRTTVRAHHEEEERELFPAVLASAAAGPELEQVRALTARLTREHREVEAGFERIEPALRAAAKGHEAALDAAEVGALVQRYEAHARFEEQVFLPLAQQILGRNGNHLAALGLSLHLRHVLPEVLARYGARF